MQSGWVGANEHDRPPPVDPSGREIFIGDGDLFVRDTLALAFALEGFEAASFAEGHALLAAARSQFPAAIILDISLPGLGGLDVLKQLGARDFRAPIFIISIQRDPSIVVEAIKNGACDFIEKPFDPSDVVARVRRAIEAAMPDRESVPELDIGGLQFPGRDKLTPREREVLALVANGASSKVVGGRLGIATRTVEVHRAHIMDKVGAKNAADLARIVLNARRRPAVIDDEAETKEQPGS